MHTDHFSPVCSDIRNFTTRNEFYNPVGLPKSVAKLKSKDISPPRNPPNKLGEKRSDRVVKHREKTSGRILDFIGKNKSIRIPEMTKKIGISDRSIEKALGKLKKEGLTKRIGSDKGGRWKNIQNL
jgi:predicted HTH transcriptional regulator